MILIKKIWRILHQKILHFIGIILGNPITHMPEHFVIIAPHPDDEVFGCGGLISKCTENNKKSEILFLTQGEASHQQCCNIPINQIGAQRMELAARAAEILGVSQYTLVFPAGKDGNLPRKCSEAFGLMAGQLTEAIKRAAPEAVFCPHPCEGWPDHIAASELTIAAIDMLPAASKPKLYYYCVWFWYSMPLHRALKLNWGKARILNISAQLPLKRQAMSVYLDAFAPCGKPWVGKLPKELLRSFDRKTELFFEADKIIETII